MFSKTKKPSPYASYSKVAQKLAQVVRKQGHKGQFGLNKNKKVSQFT